MNEHLSKAVKVTAAKLKTEKKLEESTVKINESVAKAAFYYEKLRNVIEYQDEHLFLKNAIKRIIKRHKVFASPDIPQKLLRELVWAGYFKNNSLPTRYEEDIDQIIKKYDFIRKNVRSGFLESKRINSIFLGLIACDIENILSPSVARTEFVDFAKDLIKDNIDLPPTQISPSELDVQIDISIEKILFKADYDQLFFKLFARFYREWPDIDKDQATELSKNFARVFNLIDSWIAKNKVSKVQRYTKKQLPVFFVLWNIMSFNSDPEGLFESKQKIKETARLFINARNKELVGKVMRAITKGIVFILLTKTIFAMLIELPYESRFLGEVNYMALGINILLPPLILLIAGFFIKTPGRRNDEKLVNMIELAAFENKLSTKKLSSLKENRAKNYVLYNTIYFVLSIVILVLVGWLLYAVHFNPVSIALFFVFVSLVSFLAFRTRATAKELEIESTEDGLISGVVSFLLLPFVSIGKYLSDKWSDYNFMLFFWDFVVEAPLKTVIMVFESWLSFTREKREDFE